MLHALFKVRGRGRAGSRLQPLQEEAQMNVPSEGHSSNTLEEHEELPFASHSGSSPTDSPSWVM